MAPLDAQADAWFAHEGIESAHRGTVRRLELRYAGQNFELAVEVPAGELDAGLISRIVEEFHVAHERVYGYRSPEARIEAVTFRLEASGQAAHVELREDPLAGEDASAAIVGTRNTCFDPADGYTPIPVYDRALLVPGNRISGPAIVEQMDTTTVLLPGDECSVDTLRNLVIRTGEQ